MNAYNNVYLTIYLYGIIARSVIRVDPRIGSIVITYPLNLVL